MVILLLVGIPVVCVSYRSAKERARCDEWLRGARDKTIAELSITTPRGRVLFSDSATVAFLNEELARKREEFHGGLHGKSGRISFNDGDSFSAAIYVIKSGGDLQLGVGDGEDELGRVYWVHLGGRIPTRLDSTLRMVAEQLPPMPRGQGLNNRYD